jgi:hypothetical protein
MDTARLYPLLRNLALLLLLTLPQTVTADEGLETKVKAAYLFHLVKFVEWPALPPGEIRICVYGSKTMGAMLTELGYRQLKERTLKIVADGPDDMSPCQVIYIGRAETRWHKLLEKASEQNILTVSAIEAFAQQGGMVGFYTESGKIKLEVNPEAARKGGLHISSKLLELAHTVPAAKE